jgi:predicted hydrolase (HD superfamily)
VTARSYVKPNRSIHEVEAKSVRKRLKDKAFARSVNRDDIVEGAAGLRVDLDEHNPVLHRSHASARGGSVSGGNATPGVHCHLIHEC